jgi:hypothetical protein
MFKLVQGAGQNVRLLDIILSSSTIVSPAIVVQTAPVCPSDIVVLFVLYAHAVWLLGLALIASFATLFQRTVALLANKCCETTIF